MICVDNVSVSLGGVKILNEITCEFKDGEITGIIGRNGSGKSVLLKTICGFYNADEGNILINDKIINSSNAHRFSIGSLINGPSFLKSSNGRNNLKYTAKLIYPWVEVNQKVKELMNRVGLDYSSSKHVGAYSLGMKQKLGIAQAIMGDPEILILDEPMNGLDTEATAIVEDIIKSYKTANKTVILTSHYIDDLSALCDKMYRMENGILTDFIIKKDA